MKGAMTLATAGYNANRKFDDAAAKNNAAQDAQMQRHSSLSSGHITPVTPGEATRNVGKFGRAHRSWHRALNVHQRWH